MTAIPPEKIERIETMAAESIEKTRLAVNEKLDKASRRIADAAEELRATDLVDENNNGTFQRAKSLLSENKQLLADKARQVSGLAQSGYGQVRDGVKEAGARAKTFTRENPVKSAAIAVGLGIVTGLAVRQTRS